MMDPKSQMREKSRYLHYRCWEEIMSQLLLMVQADEQVFILALGF